MRLIAFITEGTQIRRILEHIGVDSHPSHISPARGPPLWDDCGAQSNDGGHFEPDWDLAAQARVRHQMTQVVDSYRARFKLATTKGSTERLESVF
jgi:hypothetical protein